VSNNGRLSEADTVTVVARDFSVPVSWPTVEGDTLGYVVTIGSSVTSKSFILPISSVNWDSTNPFVKIDHDDMLAAAPDNSEVCISVKAYDLVGASPESEHMCVAVR